MADLRILNCSTEGQSYDSYGVSAVELAGSKNIKEKS